MNWSMISTIPASLFDWVHSNIPALGIILFIGWMIWKYASWLNGKFSTIDARFAQHDTKFTRFEHKLEEVDARLEKVDARLDKLEVSIHKLDVRVAVIETKIDDLAENMKRVLSILEGNVRFS